MNRSRRVFRAGSVFCRSRVLSSESGSGGDRDLGLFGFADLRCGRLRFDALVTLRLLRRGLLASLFGAYNLDDRWLLVLRLLRSMILRLRGKRGRRRGLLTSAFRVDNLNGRGGKFQLVKP